MSAKVNLGITVGSLVLLLVIGVVVITGSESNKQAALEAAKHSEIARINSIAAKEQSIKNNIDTMQVNKTLSDFIDKWQERIQISNKNNNNTQDKLLNISSELQERQKNLLNLANNQSKVLEYQIMNEQQIIQSEKDILGNLTSHRLVANHTNNIVNNTLQLQLEQQRQLLDIQNKTGELIKSFNATNEEERGKAVQNIIDQLHADHKIIMKGLNISANDNKTEASTNIDQLKALIESLGNKTQ